MSTKSLTPAEKIIAVRSYLDDMLRIVNETADQAAERAAFFGEGYDKNEAVRTLAAKIAAVLK